jgi:hypothetical protein
MSRDALIAAFLACHGYADASSAPLAAAMDRWIPPAMRANPRGLAA